MSRILVLIPLMIYLGTAGQPSLWIEWGWRGGAMVLLGIILLVFVTGLWGRSLARAANDTPDYVAWIRFQRGLLLARILIVVWFALGAIALGYANWVRQLMGPVETRFDVRLPGLLIATFPAIIGFMGLWWSAYPVERLMRERSVLLTLNDGLPVRRPPGFIDYFISNFRLQLLFVLVPVLGVIVLSDIFTALLRATDIKPDRWVGEAILLGSVAVIFVLVPVALVHVLRTSSLEKGSPLRKDLDDVARVTKQSFHDIRVWHTNHSMSNAAVMGVIRRARFVLMSDLLIETLTPRQLQAVFAHEAGHVRYHHLAWYALYLASFLMVLAAPADWLFGKLLATGLTSPDTAATVITTIIAIVFIYLFGMLARLFERQADAYAARTLELLPPPQSDLFFTPSPFAPASLEGAQTNQVTSEELDNSGKPDRSPDRLPDQIPVGRRGARDFASALSRVVEINHMPYDPRPRFGSVFVKLSHWLAYRTSYFLHPSPAERLEHLEYLSRNPAASAAFDQKLHLTRVALLLLFGTLIVWTTLWLTQQP